MNDLVKNIVTANRRIKAVDGGVRETPLDESGVFSERTGANFLLKGEHLQRTGSFKMRGAMNKMLCLTDEERHKGVITASSGNHGMATTQAASVAGLEVTVYLPETVSPLKLANMRSLGANTVLVPGNGVEAEISARAAAESEGKVFVSPYSDFDVIAGQGTVGLEMVEQCTDLAAVYVCVGGGGLISGIGSYLKTFQPQADIIGCWPENAPAMHLCMEKGEIYDTPETPTLSDGSAGGIEPGAITLPLCQQVIDRQLLISEAEIAAAMRDMATAERFIIEGAAGVALAAALHSAADYRGCNIAVVVCGRNITLDSFRSVLGN
ncbi:MAG: threonine/serine dehydratase [Gammaproteobacteria bacterium]|nr:threonine/serine dehydratase [Gammaproteobacteria bacterium]